MLAADDIEGAKSLQTVLSDRTLRWLLAMRRASGNERKLVADQLLDRALRAPQRVLYDIFVLNKEIPYAHLSSTLDEELVTMLDKYALIERRGSSIASSGLVLQDLFGAVFFSGQNRLNGSYVHFGVDTVRLMELAISQPFADRGLVLCTGHAGDAIALASRCRTVDAVELVHEVARVARLNTYLSGVAETVTVHEGDLFEPLAGKKFDVILANPPFSPSLDDPYDDPAAVGGADGLDVARRIWRGGEDSLSESGIMAQFLGMLGDEQKPFVMDELREMALEMGMVFYILPVSSAQKVNSLHIPSLQEEPLEKRKSQVQQGADRVGASHYHVGVVLMCRSTSPSVLLEHNSGLTASFLRSQMKIRRRQK